MPRSGNHSQVRRAGRRLLLAACLLAVLLIPAAQATPGALDPSFGTGGKVTTAIGLINAQSQANGLSLQPDGKLVAAGTSLVYGATGYDFALARYNPNGSLDSSFNGTGTVTTTFGSGGDVASALVRQPDGKLVAAGFSYNGSNYDFALARYNADGSLDTSFNGTGQVTTAIGSGADFGYGLALQPDGKLVVAGRTHNGSKYDFALARYNPNGSLDTSFNGTGKVTTAIGSSDDAVNALALQPDGKIVVAGDSRDGGQLVVALARYNPNGSLDSSFGSGGKVATAIGDTSTAAALALQPDGKLVVAGTGHTGSQLAFALARYGPNGSLDPAFGSSGKVTTAIGSTQDTATKLAQQPDGKLVAVGFSYAGSRRVFALARYETNGSLDPGFGSGGKITTAIGSDDQARGLALQPDGKLVAAGYSYNGSNDQFALVRYLGSTLTVTKAGSGSGTVTSNASEINCGPTCSAPFAAVPVQLTATASPGSSFTGWSGDCSATGTCTVTVSADRAVTATFESDKTLTLKKAGSGAGTVTSTPAGLSCGSTCAQAFKHDTAVTLTAVASGRSRFAGWSGACSGATTRCTVSMNAARSMTATFKALCVVPKVKGKKLLAAKRALKKAHCSVGKVTRVFSARVRKGRVISPKPKARKKLAPGARIKLVVSKGKRT